MVREKWLIQHPGDSLLRLAKSLLRVWHGPLVGPIRFYLSFRRSFDGLSPIRDSFLGAFQVSAE